VKDIGQLLEGAEDASDGLVLRREHHHHGNKESPMTARENDGNDDELRGSSSSSSQESSFPDQADREDDEDEEQSPTEEERQRSMIEEEEKKSTYDHDVRQSLNGPINLAELRISMPVKTDEIADSLAFFESLLKENYGEFRFRKAMQIIEDFPGDIYKDERKILQRLSAKELFGAGEVAQNFLYECTSFLLMKQNIQGFQGKPIGLLTV
jgi:hypothetical protein